MIEKERNLKTLGLLSELIELRMPDIRKEKTSEEEKCKFDNVIHALKQTFTEVKKESVGFFNESFYFRVKHRLEDLERYWEETKEGKKRNRSKPRPKKEPRSAKALLAEKVKTREDAEKQADRLLNRVRRVDCNIDLPEYGCIYAGYRTFIVNGHFIKRKEAKEAIIDFIMSLLGADDTLTFTKIDKGKLTEFICEADFGFTKSRYRIYWDDDWSCTLGKNERVRIPYKLSIDEVMAMVTCDYHKRMDEYRATVI